MRRCAGWNLIVGKKLVLVVGRASYRDFFGTNLNGGREIARRFRAVGRWRMPLGLAALWRV